MVLNGPSIIGKMVNKCRILHQQTDVKSGIFDASNLDDYGQPDLQQRLQG